jgi:hypothetical protein
MKKTNNKYYIRGVNGEYKEVKAKKYNNIYNLDLFEFRDNYGINISEGKTGMRIFRGTTTHEAFLYKIKNIGGIESFNKMIDDKILEFGLSPRYNTD